MKDFKQNNKFGGGNRGGDRGSFRGGGNSFGKRDFGGQREMFDAVCAKCNKPCQVPFRPNGERPVYCRDCFGDNKPDRPQGQSNFPPRNDFPRREFNTPPVSKANDAAHVDIKRQLDAINAKLDKLIQKIEGPQKQVTPVSAAATKESLGEVLANAQKAVKKEPAKKISKKASAKKK